MFTDQMWNSQEEYPLKIFKRILPCVPLQKGLNRKRWRDHQRQKLRKTTSDLLEEGPSGTIRGCSWRRPPEESTKIPKRQIAAMARENQREITPMLVKRRRRRSGRR